MYVIGIDINGSVDALWTEGEQVCVFDTLSSACAALNQHYMDQLQAVNDGYMESVTFDYRLFKAVPNLNEWYIPETGEFTSEILTGMGVGVHGLT